MKILILSSEVTPLIKAGGLGDVTGSLPKALVKQYDLDIIIMIPKYKSFDDKKNPNQKIISKFEITLPSGEKYFIDVYKTPLPQTNISVYMIDMPKFFNGDGVYSHHPEINNIQWVNFSKAALDLLKKINFQPDVIHIQFSTMGLVPKWLKTIYKNDPFYQKIATLTTLHNMTNSGKIDFANVDLTGLKMKDYQELREITGDSAISIAGEAINNSDMFNTVSPTCVKETLTEKFDLILNKIILKNKNRFTGILNGIDYSSFDPRVSPDVPVKYWIDSLDKKNENKLYLQKKFGLTQNPDSPLICAVTRISRQKGLLLIDKIMDEIMDMGAQFIILGSGEDSIEKLFIKAEKKNPQMISAQMTFDEHLAQTIYAGADILLMPSQSETCGLSQIIAMRFGTVPVVRSTGGLADTVIDGKTGFVFNDYDEKSLLASTRQAVSIFYNHKDDWRKIQIEGMRKDFSWNISAEKYIQLYEKVIKHHNSECK
ncbi:MAG: glycogen/starch synthase, starch synthase [Berkelbacteria bacterium GW2011_GWE1_39_12]|uniref:Glycogen synthase n=1 Tax=Berkelbacteria bacterium GW2011_GWE1_39_12 TaxID=1618337 RepID=A0A0G4B4W2_9BACT|nr:MAG: glycogen/starch synthase, starch synthase [Berkelbacteria bacterium GW2011_GWE1_39_12]